MLVRILTSRGEMSEALAASVRAREIYEALHRERPDLLDYATRLAISLDLETYQLRMNGRAGEALAASERSQALLRPIVEANPQVIDYKEQLAVAYNMAGDLARQLGRIDAVGDFAVKARDLMEALQRALALSVAGDAARSEREALATAAMAGLRRAVSGGLTDVNLYRTDSDLDSLRSRDDFRRFMKGLETPSPPNSR